MFELKESGIKGCFEIGFKKLEDRRGTFTKTFHSHALKDLGLDMDFKEEYFTYSHKNVFRGLHFQTPPKGIAKMVYCVNGQVTDYVVDLRKDSPTYGQWKAFELDGEKPSMVFVPIGLAHGFYVKSSSALMQYKVSDVFDPACDSGISYTSFPFAAQIVNPIISDRDMGFVSFADYKSPFTL